MVDREIQGIWHLLEERWEERSLNLLHDSKIHEVVSKSMYENKGKRKQHTLKWMQKKSMAIPEAILELQNGALRESALRCLSNFLLEKREADPEKYNTTGYMLYFSCSTVALLLQEVLVFHRLMKGDNLTTRACKRLINVLTLFQCIAANAEARQKVVDSLIPNYIIPIMMFKTSFDGFENVRAVALSVFGILCQGREPHIIKWALENEVPEASQVALEIGNELSRVIAMHIFEAILRNDLGISYICSPYNNRLLGNMMRTWNLMLSLMSCGVELTPRLLFHILRCCVLLCTHPSGLSIVRENAGGLIFNRFFIPYTETFPKIKHLVEQLQFTVGNWYN